MAIRGKCDCDLRVRALQPPTVYAHRIGRPQPGVEARVEAVSDVIEYETACGAFAGSERVGVDVDERTQGVIEIHTRMHAGRAVAVVQGLYQAGSIEPLVHRLAQQRIALGGSARRHCPVRERCQLLIAGNFDVQLRLDVIRVLARAVEVRGGPYPEAIGNAGKPMLDVEE